MLLLLLMRRADIGLSMNMPITILLTQTCTQPDTCLLTWYIFPGLAVRPTHHCRGLSYGFSNSETP